MCSPPFKQVIDIKGLPVQTGVICFFLKELASKETQKKLNDLAKAAGKFLSQQLEDFEELTVADVVD